MACTNCSCGADTTNGTPAGCGNKGTCSTGGCNKLNTFDWLANIDLPETDHFDMIEVSFKGGARKDFFFLPRYLHVVTGDNVVVESLSGGFDIGRVSLMGELVGLQMKKKRVRDNAKFFQVLRVAHERDLERLKEAREKERDTMIKARVIARDLGLNMKIGDVEYQGDKRKVTFYYTADGRVDFRELIRFYAREFKVKIEMRQIGARQESARIGGIGACGRELCCSTWLTDFKSVSTVAARYQNLAINQSKLSGQCGRLKCCLNYELATYLDALKEFPSNITLLKTKKGDATLLKTDIFKRLLYFSYRQKAGFSEVHALSIERVREIYDLNKKNIYPEDLVDLASIEFKELDKEIKFENVNDVIDLEELKKHEKNKKRRKKKRPKNAAQNKPNEKQNSNNNQKQKRGGHQQKGGNQNRDSQNKNPRQNKNNTPNRGPQNKQKGQQQNKGQQQHKGQQNRSKANHGPKTNNGPKANNNNRPNNGNGSKPNANHTNKNKRRPNQQHSNKQKKNHQHNKPVAQNDKNTGKQKNPNQHNRPNNNNGQGNRPRRRNHRHNNKNKQPNKDS